MFNRTGLAIKIIVAVLALALIREKSAGIAQLDFRVGDASANLRAIFAFWLSILAPGFYLCALWALGAFFSRVSPDNAFAPGLVKSLRETGQNLLIGALAAIAIEPAVSVWLMEGFGGPRFDFRIEDVTIAFIAASRLILAGFGQSLRTELDQFV